MATELRGAGHESSGKNPQPTELRDERCRCGNLVAKFTEETVEIKCRRCKRIHVIPVQKEKRGQKRQQDGAIDECCECGNKLAMISEETVEIKCRSCKCIHVIPVKVENDYWQRKNPVAQD